ncbi:related to CWC21 - protein involved in RNA splicing by the spliceosome [Ustilago bromivora]|uniref:Related to CWC21 - protein involved in RNA splicing by the spliceosome n=1 Tax=Ustilago bromivora TaxID=307758 RepID=A0A8H8TRL9_9BASI|nr:related to CWC21 - protein involved in RNA splicing by the spliceosome [Ustilago bromivora]
MYNGIGLKTVRGTGTNGYIQRNLSNFRPRDNPFNKSSSSRHSSSSETRHVQLDAAILEHERKRKVEVRCMELRVQLEDDDVEEDEIESQVSALREKLMAELEREKEPSVEVGPSREERGKLRQGETHKLLQAKQADDRRLASALGMESGYREGDAFDRELQERKKQERLEERRKADEQRKLDWERKKREREDEKRARERRDGGWGGRGSRRSPSPRPKKRGKYDSESDSEEYSTDDSRRELAPLHDAVYEAEASAAEVAAGVQATLPKVQAQAQAEYLVQDLDRQCAEGANRVLVLGLGLDRDRLIQGQGRVTRKPPGPPPARPPSL